MYFDDFFVTELQLLRKLGNYRVFNGFERDDQNMPRTKQHVGDGIIRDNTVWYSNDFIGMKQHPKVTFSMKDTFDSCDEDIKKLVSALSELWFQCALARAAV